MLIIEKNYQVRERERERERKRERERERENTRNLKGNINTETDKYVLCYVIKGDNGKDNKRREGERITKEEREDISCHVLYNE